MSSYFDEMLNIRGFYSHDGRPLWKYNLSKEEYDQLKSYLQRNNRREIDPRDVTLFFAEWWKNEYQEGSPTKVDIYKSVEGCQIDQEDFYSYAKRGAVLLGVRWIQRRNILYFRTLLMQGGLPINHILNFSGNYTNFLKKVIEINPSTIEEFSYEDDIIKYLPFSSRNEEIYESCLSIVQAIWNGNEEYLRIFEIKSANFRKISDELKEYKRQIEKTARKRIKFRAVWILRLTNNTEEISLKFNFPEVIEQAEFADLINSDIKILLSEYNLIIEDLLICKFRQNINGDYKIYWYNNSELKWNGEETKPEMYLSSGDGKIFSFQIIMVDYPKISEPTLWTKISENKYKLNHGKNCKEKNAFILFPNYWNANSNCKIKKITLINQEFNFIEFLTEITLSQENKFVTFKTNSSSFEWFISESRPNWIVKSNIPVVTKVPKIIVYGKDGERLTGIKKYYRTSGDWHDWNETYLPSGCIEFKIIALDCEETDYFYNLDNFNVDFRTNTETSNVAKVFISDNSRFTFKIKESELYTVQKINQHWILTLNDVRKGVHSVPATIYISNQRRSLQLELVSPFQGIQILSPEGDLLESSSIILLQSLNGYRIVKQNLQKNYIKIYNIKKPSVKFYKNIERNIVPLREYENIAFKLFKLSDANDKESAVAFEFYDNNDELKITIFLKNYNTTLNYENLNGQYLIQLDPNDAKIELFSIPLDCAPDNISIVSLAKEFCNFIFFEKVYSDKDMIFSVNSGNSYYSIAPNIIDRSVARKNIVDYIEKLNDNDRINIEWSKLLKYYKIASANDIPFSAFDLLRAATSSPDLAAKLFCYISVFEENEDYIENSCRDLENELGFSFHWISKFQWDNALIWVERYILNVPIESDVINIIKTRIRKLIMNNEPLQWFHKIFEAMNDNEIEQIDFHFNSEINYLGQKLGERVLNELPDVSPKIPNNFKYILPVTGNNYRLKVLLKTPLAIALSLTGKDESIWKSEETVRRNMQYCQWIDSEWYGKAIYYCVSRLKNI